MPRKPALLLRIADIKSITMRDDPADGAILRFAMDGEPNDLDLQLPALAIARLQALLLQADAKQAHLVTNQ